MTNIMFVLLVQRAYSNNLVDVNSKKFRSLRSPLQDLPSAWILLFKALAKPPQHFCPTNANTVGCKFCARLATHIGHCWVMLEIVGWCRAKLNFSQKFWMLLNIAVWSWNGLATSTQQNHVRASAMVKAHPVLNLFSWVKGSYWCNLRNVIKLSPFISPVCLFYSFATPIFYFTIFFAISRNFNHVIVISLNNNKWK